MLLQGPCAVESGIDDGAAIGIEVAFCAIAGAVEAGAVHASDALALVALAAQARPEQNQNDEDGEKVVVAHRK